LRKIGEIYKCGGCGRLVSREGETCLKCTRNVTALEVAKQDAPAAHATHILMIHASRKQEDLYRADGMLVASRQDDLVRFGHDIATAQSRLFLNSELAAAWIRRMADIDIEAEAIGEPVFKLVYGYERIPERALIETRDIEKQVDLLIVGDVKGARLST
jgi:hypothetical protein